MDIDARINWMPGMELTAQTFRQLYRNLDFRQQIAVRAALGGSRMGLVPGAVFDCSGLFVKNSFEIERLQCMAVLRSGSVLSVDEKVSLAIPVLFGDQYYLTVAFGEGERTFEVEEVPFVCTPKVYAIHTLEELEKEDLFPLVRFSAAGGIFSVDSEYIPPCLLLDADERFAAFGATYVEKLSALAAHANLEEGEGKRAILRYLFQLKSYQWKGEVREFVKLTQELAQAIDYYIVTPHASAPVEIPAPNLFDIQKWLQWLSDYLAGASTILDSVVLEDHTIDFEALLAQAKAELYERLNPELRADLLLQIKEELRGELQQTLSQTLMEFINGSLRTALHDNLQAELDPELHDRLYQELYEQLYNALYVPEEEEEAYIPMI